MTTTERKRASIIGPSVDRAGGDIDEVLPYRRLWRTSVVLTLLCRSRRSSS
jgi:hypothetical protein